MFGRKKDVVLFFVIKFALYAAQNSHHNTTRVLKLKYIYTVKTEFKDLVLPFASIGVLDTVG